MNHCEDCNIFHESCDGRLLYDFDAKENRCKNQVTTPTPTKSPLQVEAFRSLFKTKTRRGMSNITAFAEAIVQTNDDVFNQAAPDMIHEYKELANIK